MLAATLMAGVPTPFSPQSETVIVAELEKAGEKQPEKVQNEITETKPVVTRHKVVVKGREINYTATAGQLPIINDVGETEAQIFYFIHTQ